MRAFTYVLPRSPAEASAEGAAKDAALKAGGIDLLDLMKAGVFEPERLVNVAALTAKPLRAVTVGRDGTHIGALCTLATLASDAKLPAALREAAAQAATPQIRNVATVGGNLCQRPRCWYFRQSHFNCLKKGGKECFAIPGENRYHAVLDTTPCPMVHPSNLAPALLALGATVVTGARRIPIGELFVAPAHDVTREHALAPGEVITEVVVPARAGAHSAYREAREKDSFDWALVAAAAALELDGTTVRSARLALGAVAPVPVRAGKAEAFLAGQRVTAQNAARAAEIAFNGAKPLSGNAYKLPLGRAILARAILAAAGQPETGG